MRARRRQRFARGDLATAMCPVCGFVVGYRDLVRDWRGKWVCADCKDLRPPQPVTALADVQQLHHPQPWLHNYPPAARVEEQAPLPIDIEPAFWRPPELATDGGPADAVEFILFAGEPGWSPPVVLAGGAP